MKQELMDKLKGMKSDEMIIFMPPSEREFLYTVPTDGSTPKRLIDKDIAALKPGDKIQTNRHPRAVFADGTEKDFQGFHELTEYLIPAERSWTHTNHQLVTPYQPCGIISLASRQ
jgi:hypothetical protein